MAFKDQASLILLAFLGWCSALAIHKQLTVIQAVSEVVERPSTSSSRVDQQTQDGTAFLHVYRFSYTNSLCSAIKLSTLSQLLQSQNSEVRDASINIIAERALQSSSVWRLLRQQLRSTKDPQARDQALRILVHFGPESTYDDRMRRAESRNIEYDGFFHPATFKATVACLCNMLPTARAAENHSRHHDSAEADALWFASKLLDHNADLVLKAGLVKRWLVNYPFMLRDPGKTKEEVIRDMILSYEYADDYERLLCCILCDLTEDTQARQQMAKYGLGEIASPHGLLKLRAGQNWGVRQQYQNPWELDRHFDGPEHERGMGEVSGVAAAMMDLSRTTGRDHGEGAQDEIFPPNFDQTGIRRSGAEIPEGQVPSMHPDDRISRRQEETAEERALRSRRREAMVFAEAGSPLGQQHIIESQRGANMDEDELRRLAETESRVMAFVIQWTVEGLRTWAAFLFRLRPDGSTRE